MTSTRPSSWSHVIATDIPENEKWTFAQKLGECLNIHFRVERYDGQANIPRWRRIIIYVIMALKLFIHHRHINVLVCWQQFFGLIYASLCQLFHVKKHTNLLVMGFIYRPKTGITGKLYRWWIQRTLTSGYIGNIIVYSQQEVEYYSNLLTVDSHLFHFIPLAIDTEDVIDVVDDGFWFSTGKSNRDYSFLVNALSNTDYRLIIACDELTQPDADNIKVFHNTFGNDMLRLMGRAHGVIIALDNEHVSSGQLVMLQAMSLSKPIVITRSDSITDYVKNEVNALVIDKTKTALLQAIDKLDKDADLYHRISTASKEQFESLHSMASFTQSVASLIHRQ